MDDSSSTADQRDDFDVVTFDDLCRRIVFTRHHFAIDFDGKVVWRHIHRVEQFRDRHRGLNFDGFAVYGDREQFNRPLRQRRRRRLDPMARSPISW